MNFTATQRQAKSIVKNGLRIGACAAAVLSSMQAHAQSADLSPEQNQASEGSQEVLGDIIVTADRRRESLQRTSLAIDVVSQDQISRAGLTNAEDLSTLTPGVQIGGNGAFTQIFIRGVGDRSNTQLSNPSVSTNLNGVPLLRSTAVNGNFFDLERVEILKGPQGTLYGRNATGGALNIITARPGQEFGGYLTGEIGSDDLLKLEGAVNAPLSSTLAVRGAFQIVSRDGYLSDGTSDDRQQNVRLSAKWEPSSALTLFISGGHSHQGGKGSGLALIHPRCSTGACLDPYTGVTDPVVNAIRINNDPPASSSLFSYPLAGFEPKLDNNVSYILAQADWDFGPATMTVLPSYVRNHYVSNTYPGLVFANDFLSKQKTIEVRFSNESPVLKWVWGGFATDENQTGVSIVRQNPAGTGASNYITLPDGGVSINSKAIFGQATYSVTPVFRLLGGIRYTHETSRLNQNMFTCSTAACPGTLAFSIDNKAVTTRKTTWKAGVEFDLTPRNFFYATYSTGFKAAGLYAAPIADPSYRPETIEAYQIGLRNRFLDGRLQLNVEAFRWNYRDQVYNFVGPVPGTTFVSNVFINIGRGYVQGLSADVVAKPWNGATLRGAIEYADSKYTDFQYDAVPGQRGPANTTCVVGAIHTNSAGVAVQTVDCSGRPFILASKWSGNASFEQEFGLQNGGAIRLNAGMTFNSSRFAQFEFLPSQLLPGAVVVDLSASYTSPSERWSVRLYVQNVTDIVTYSQAQALTGTSRASSPAGGPVVAGAIGAPRRFGASLGIKF